MKTISLKYLPGILLLRSDRILWELIVSLTGSNVGPYIKNSDLLRSSGFNTPPLAAGRGSFQMSIHDFRSMQFRQTDIKRAIGLLSNNSENTLDLNYSYDFLRKWFDALFKINGAEIHVLSGQEELISVIYSKVHPYTILAYTMAEQYCCDNYSIDDLFQFVKSTTSLASHQPNPETDFVENHIHIYGAQETGPALMGMLESQHRTADTYYEKTPAQTPHAPEFSLINCDTISVGFLMDLFKLCSLYLLEKCLLSQPMENICLVQRLKYLLWGVKFHEQNVSIPSRYLFRFINRKSKTVELLRSADYFRRSGERNRELFFYCIYLHSIHLISKDNMSKWCAKISLHCINILRSLMVMSQNTGLENFADFYDSKLRRENWNYQDIAANIIHTGTTKVEGKISPKAIEFKSFFYLADALDQEIAKRRQALYPNCGGALLPNKFPLAFGWQTDLSSTRAPRWQYHFVVHFIRKNDTKTAAEFRQSALSKEAPVRFKSFRRELEQDALKIKRFLLGHGYKNVSAFLYNLSLKNRIFFRDYPNWRILAQKKLNLTNLIVGLDVAGKETITPPEVFAPVILFLRSLHKCKSSSEDFLIKSSPKHRQLMLSVHAGEDFSHILTGLRRIDETVHFYQMTSGDRLGHALALGLSPLKWTQKVEEILITQGEHLDDLVWLYHHLVRMSETYPSFLPFLHRYAEEIYIYSQKIYDKPVLPEVLFRAWRMRSNCPIRFFNENYKHYIDQDPMIAAGINFTDWEEQSEINSFLIPSKSKEFFNRYHRDFDVRRKMDEVLRFGFSYSNGTPGPFTIGAKEIELWHALQDYLMSLYSDKGLIIETNPSSNVYISRLENYGDHPIFRFSPPKPYDLEKDGRFNKYGLRNSVMPVCVNTDDPSIFPTTLPNEFNLLKSAAKKYHNCSESEADQWIDALRKHGVKLFLENHQPILI